MDGQTNRPMDRGTDRVTYRVACTRLKRDRNEGSFSSTLIFSNKIDFWDIDIDIDIDAITSFLNQYGSIGD